MPSNRVPISVLIPAKNESRNIERCLSHVSGWADEIVVVDSQSTDDTIEIAESHQADVVQFRYAGGWPKKRQWALDNHPWRNDWILLLDADEYLTDEIKREIETAIENKRFDGYYLKFRPIFLGKNLRFGDSELRKLSLFRRGAGRYEKRYGEQDESMADMEIHEHVIVDGPTRCLRHAVGHETCTSLDRYIEKHNWYSTWEAHVMLYGTDAEMRGSLWGNQAQRRRWLKKTLMRLPGSPILRFLYVYVLHAGCLDGRAGVIYATFKFQQMCHVKAKIYEISQRSADEDRKIPQSEQGRKAA